MNISAVIITFNEERNIARCLESLQGVADEIVVVDSFSTDKTEEICKSFGVTFVSQKWLGYGEQKNFGNAGAANDWILSVDADEALSQQLKESILAIKKTEQKAEMAFEMNRLTNYCGSWIKHCGWYPDRKIRLFNRNTVKWDNRRVHEKLIFQPNIFIKHLQGDMLHYTICLIAEHIVQINKYSSLMAEEYFKRGKKISLLGAVLKSKWSFLQKFILKGGFLDGYAGFLICKNSAFSIFLRYIKLKELQQTHS